MTDEPTTAAGRALLGRLARAWDAYAWAEARLGDDILAIEAEARREGAAEAAAEILAGRIAAHVNDGSGERSAMAWSEGHTAGYEEGRREGVAEVLAAALVAVERIRAALETLILASRDRDGVCRFCRAEPSYFHARGCDVETAIRVLEPTYGDAAYEAERKVPRDG